MPTVELTRRKMLHQRIYLYEWKTKSGIHYTLEIFDDFGNHRATVLIEDKQKLLSIAFRIITFLTRDRRKKTK